MAVEEELAAAAKGYYATTLEKLQGAYRNEGTRGFHKVWDELDDTAQRFILKHYEQVSELATDAIARDQDIVDAIFDRAFVDAAEMKQKLLSESLAEGAAGYVLKLPAVEAEKGGFQEQLKILQEALSDGSFTDVLTGFGEEMTAALIQENEWLQVIIDAFAKAEEGALSLTDATALMNEHIQGTQEHFLASVEALTEANGTALDAEQAHIDMLTSLMAMLGQDNGMEAFSAAFSMLDDNMRKALFDKSDALKKFFYDIKNGTDDAGEAVKEMGREVNRLKLDKLAKQGKAFTGLADAIEDAGKGGKAFAKSYGAVLNQVEGLSEATGALAFLQGTQKKKADDVTDAYNVLASYTGVSADMLRNDLSPAMWAIASDAEMAAFSTEQLLDQLIALPGVHFDASNWQVELARLATSADETVAHLAQLISTMLQASGSSLYLENNTVKVKWGSHGSYTPPSARKSGGGGGSKDMDKAISAIERLIEMMRQTVALQDHGRELMQLAQDYHEVRGEVQGVIAYMQREQQVIAESTATVQGYVAQLEAEMGVKRQQIAGMSTAAKEYEQLAKELDELQKLHQDYSKQLIRNRTDQEKLTKAIKEQKDAIRQMEIDLRNLIHDAILDREALNRRMLQGTIDVENEIIDILTKRYELERDEAAKTADLKRKVLEEEMRLLDEQLAKRKELEDREDKLKKLKQLEEQVARISMDPTRRKEELSLREQIAKLRKEMAWDAAEDEVNAQKDALQKQIDSIDEYLEYVNSYYEELLANPRKLIEEMAWLMEKTDAEIIAWLKENHADYADMTDAMRKGTVNGWQSMLDDMRGFTRMFWDEVESIIAQGDDAIIAFLMEHSQEYKEAGRLQAEAFVDQWKQKLEDLRNAYKSVKAEIDSYNYTPIKPSDYVPPSGSGGGGSSNPRFVKSGTGTAETTKSSAQTITHDGYAFVKDPKTDYWYRQSEAKTIDGGRTYYWPAGSNKFIKKYAMGGLADFSGPAWVDGSKTKPERILSPYQTVLFEDLISSLHEIRVKTPMMAAIPQMPQAADRVFHIESIQVNVERLEEDADYAAMAQKVGEYLYEEIARGAPVGGFRLGR